MNPALIYSGIMFICLALGAILTGAYVAVKKRNNETYDGVTVAAIMVSSLFLGLFSCSVYHGTAVAPETAKAQCIFSAEDFKKYNDAKLYLQEFATKADKIPNPTVSETCKSPQGACFNKYS